MPDQPVAAPQEGTARVARVVLDLPLPHLDRPFDYQVPADLDDAAQPGVRVRVRFAGRDVGGFVIERAGVSEHEGKLSALRTVVSAERVLTPEVLALARQVAAKYGGGLSDVLRLAIPPRHARVEAGAPARPAAGVAAADPAETDPAGTEPAEPPPAGAGRAAWERYPAGPALLGRLAAGESPRAVWSAPPGPEEWAAGISAAVAACLRSGRGSIVVVPDGRDLDVLDGALLTELGPGRHVRLEADLGPARRYRAFLAALRGDVQVVIGTRAAAFAPVRNLGLVAIWQDGEDVHAEQRAPYPHAREVLVLRAEAEGSAVVAASWSRSCETQQWLAAGWARAVDLPRDTRRTAWPRVLAADEAARPGQGRSLGRLPGPAFEAIRQGLTQGPVLVAVPRAGYLPGLACRTCRGPARCAQCRGPLAIGGSAEPATAQPPSCAWCSRSGADWVCPRCGDPRLRALSVGQVRTAEELGRAFPGVAVVVPRAAERAPHVAVRSIVVATPGLEVPVEDGYAAAVLLDGDLMLGQPRLRAAEDALLRWRSAAALVRSAAAGGTVVVCADPSSSAVEALVRGEPGWFAEAELAERQALRLPPAATLAVLEGAREALTDVLKLARLGVGEAAFPHEVFGPTEEFDQARATVKVPRTRGGELARRLHDASSVRSARRERDVVRARIDPVDC